MGLTLNSSAHGQSHRPFFSLLDIGNTHVHYITCNEHGSSPFVSKPRPQATTTYYATEAVTEMIHKLKRVANYDTVRQNCLFCLLRRNNEEEGQFEKKFYPSISFPPIYL